MFLNISGGLALLALGYCIAAFTPLRTTIPGYPNASTRQASLETAARIDSLEGAIIRWRLYSENLRSALNGGRALEPEVLKQRAREYMSEKSAAQLASQDSILRESLETETTKSAVAAKGDLMPLESAVFRRPVKGTVSSRFDETASPSVGITTALNEMVYAVLDGAVTYAKWSDECGYTIQLQHDNNIISSYTYTDNPFVKEGEFVKAGDAIARAGSGHIAFELWYKGVRVDPQKYIKF